MSNDKEAFLDPLGVNKSFMNKSPVFDFSDPSAPHDRVLLVEGKKFYVHSGVLIIWSKFFKELFVEKSKQCLAKEIKIEDISAEDFKTFLQFIHHGGHGVFEANCISLVKSAYRFLAFDIFPYCRAFLRKDSDESNPTQLHQSVIDISIKETEAQAWNTQAECQKSCEKKNAFYCYEHPLLDFFDPNITHDRVLVVEGKKFYVHSGVLIVWTEYCKDLFAANSNRCQSEEIEVKDVTAKDFRNFLQIIHPSKILVNGHSPISMVDLAHRFKAPHVLMLTKQLINREFKLIHKLKLLESAVKYDMEDMKEKVADFILSEKVPSSVLTFGAYAINKDCYLAKNYEQFTKLSVEARLFIFDKILEKNHQNG